MIVACQVSSNSAKITYKTNQLLTQATTGTSIDHVISSQMLSNALDKSLNLTGYNS